MCQVYRRVGDTAADKVPAHRAPHHGLINELNKYLNRMISHRDVCYEEDESGTKQGQIQV